MPVGEIGLSIYRDNRALCRTRIAYVSYTTSTVEQNCHRFRRNRPHVINGTQRGDVQLQNMTGLTSNAPSPPTVVGI